MGLARINIWITKAGRPCAIDDKNEWQVSVLDCQGKVLEWCDNKYRDMPAKCGHLDVQVPPGSYLIWARAGHQYSYPAVVDVSCEQHACVKLLVTRNPFTKPPLP